MKTHRPLHRLLSIILAAMLLSGLILHAAPVQSAQAAGFSLFQPPVFYPVGAGSNDVAIGDIDGDGDLDIVTLISSDRNIGVLTNQGDGTFSTSFQYGVTEDTKSIKLHDMNGDGTLDLIFADAGIDAIVVVLNDGSGTFSSLHPPFPVGDYPINVVVADFNKDGYPDLAASNLTGEAVSILLNTGDGTFLPQVEYPTGLNPAFLVVDDFNLDGKLDMAATNAGSTTVSVLLGKGDGTFQAKTDYGVGSAPSIAIAEDFNNDGRTDLAVANSQGDNVSLLLGNGNGTFQPKVDFAVGEQPYGMTAGDFNLDGKIDLVTANFYSGDLSLLLNQGSGVFAPAVGFPVGEYQSTVRSGDLDHDGKLDLVTENGNDSIAVLINASPDCGEDGSICYVTPTGTGDCSSWPNACGLQTALAAAQPGSEIWVAAGTYKPTDGTDRSATFTLKDGVAIYGGFAGTETERSRRDWEANVTILSGEIGVLNNPSDNILHVIKSSGNSNTAVLDGFTITDGNANTSGIDANGGGMYLYNSSTSLANLTFSRNFATVSGGALYVEKGSPWFNDCSFIDNTSQSNGGAIYIKEASAHFSGGSALRNTGIEGGAVYITKGSPEVVISDFTFEANSANSGGAIRASASNTILNDVVFTGNIASTASGGALSVIGSLTTTINRATFQQNTARYGGGAIFSDYTAEITVTNAVFFKNEATNGSGGAIYTQRGEARLINTTFYKNRAMDRGGGIHAFTLCSVIIRNSILWGNSASIFPQVAGTICVGDVTDSFIQNWNNDAVKKVYGDQNPMFVSVQDETINLRLKPLSPAINLGKASNLPESILTDVDNNPRVVDGEVDLGAFEQQNPNHPPILTQTTFEWPAMMENDTPDEGLLVADLIRNAGTDIDGDSLGISAISMVWGYGQWEFQLAGQDWEPLWLPSRTECCSVVFPSETRIRFTPAENKYFLLDNALQFQLWDMADGRNPGEPMKWVPLESTHGAYSSDIGSVTITVFPSNGAPVLSEFEDAEIIANGSYTVDYCVRDNKTPVSNLNISVQSSNTDLLHEINLIEDGQHRQLYLEPWPNVTGTTTITISVTDEDGGTSTQSFKLTVVAQSFSLFLPMTIQ